MPQDAQDREKDGGEDKADLAEDGGVGSLDALADIVQEVGTSHYARYLSEIRKFALLSQDEEAALFQNLELARKRILRFFLADPTARATLTQIYERAASVLNDEKIEVVGMQLDSLMPFDKKDQADRGRAVMLRKAIKKLMCGWLATDLRRPGEAMDQDALAEDLFLLRPNDDVLESLRQDYCARSSLPDVALMEDCDALIALTNRGYCANLAFVVYLAKKYAQQGVDIMDLISEGNEGLRIAVRKFNNKAGKRFLTYAAWWVSNKMRRCIKREKETIHIADSAILLYRKLERVRRDYCQSKGRDPSPEELAQESGLSIRQIHRAMRQQIHLEMMSLDAPRYAQDPESSLLHESIATLDTNATEDLEAGQIRTIILEAIRSFAPEKAEKLYGLLILVAGKNFSLKNAAQQLGMTNNGAMQEVERLMRRLKRDPQLQALAQLHDLNVEPELAQPVQKAKSAGPENNRKAKTNGDAAVRAAVRPSADRAGKKALPCPIAHLK